MRINRRVLLGGLSSSLVVPGVLTSNPAEAKPAIKILKQVKLGAGLAGSNYNPTMAILSDGKLIAGWINQPDPVTRYAYVRFYDDQGVALTGNIRLRGGRTAGTDAESIQVVAVAGVEAMAVFTAMTKNATPPDFTDVYVQNFSSSHAASGAPVRVNRKRPYMQSSLNCARLSNGNILVMWTTQGATADATDLIARVVSPDGVMVTDEKRATNEKAGVQVASCLAAINAGKSIFTYYAQPTDLSKPFKVYAQTLDANADRVGERVLIKSAPQASSAFGSAGVFYLPGRGVVYTWYKKAAAPALSPEDGPDYAKVVWLGDGVTHETAPVFPFNGNQTYYFPAMTNTPNGNLAFNATAIDLSVPQYDVFQFVVRPSNNKVIAGPQTTRSYYDASRTSYAAYYAAYYAYYYYYYTYDDSTAAYYAYYYYYQYYGNY